MPTARPVFDQQLFGEPPLVHVRRGGAHGRDERSLDLGAGGVTAGMEDPGDRVAALAPEGVRVAGGPVERRPHLDELSDALRSLLGEDLRRRKVAEAGTRREGVREMEFG